MAVNVMQTWNSCLRLTSTVLSQCRTLAFTQVRLKSQRHQRTRKRINPFVDRHTDFIKELCVTLVHRERLLTTSGRASLLQQYGDLLITMTQRKEPPPDLFTIRNGFFLDDDEVKKRLTRKIIKNRRSTRVIRLPTELTEEEFIKRMREEASNILLHDQSAIDKLYGILAERFHGMYGGFVKVTQVPLPDRRIYNRLAYVEFIGNSLPELPVLPEMDGKVWKRYPRGMLPTQNNLNL